MNRFLIIIAILLAALKGWAAFEVEATDHLKVWAEFPDQIIADGKTVNYINVYQHDDDDLFYTAFNMEFILPEGFRLNKVKQGRNEVNDIFFSERATSTHMISCNIVGGVDLRIIGDSSQNDDLFNDDESGAPMDLLFTIGLIAETTLDSGDYTIRMEGIKFCHKDATARVPEEESFSYTVHILNPVTSGIEDIDADTIDPKDCYDLSGRPIDPVDAKGKIVVTKGQKFLVK